MSLCRQGPEVNGALQDLGNFGCERAYICGASGDTMTMSKDSSMSELSGVKEPVDNCTLFLYSLQGVKHQNVTVFLLHK